MRAGRFAGTGRFWRIRAGRFAPGTGGRSSVPSSGSLPADYIITSDAEWDTIPAGLLSGGGIIDVAGIDYATKTLTMTPSAPLTFRRRAGDAQMPCARLVLSGAQNVVFEEFWAYSSDWFENPQAAIKLTGSTLLTFNDCKISGNYRGTRDPVYDPNDALPEMHGIYATVSGGALSFTLIHPTYGYDSSDIGDLLADGSYNAVIVATGGTGASCPFTVSSGIITLGATSGGSGYDADQEPSSMVRLPDGGSGMRVMRELMPAGVESDGSNVNLGLTFARCEFDMLNSACLGRYPSNGTGTAPMRFEDCTFDRIYMDFIASGATAVGSRDVEVINCFMSRPFANPAHAFNPHGDFFQQWHKRTSPETATDCINITVEGGVWMLGSAPGRPQGVLVQDTWTGIANKNFRIAGVTILNDGPWPIRLQNSSACAIYRCLTALYDTTNYSTTADINVGGEDFEPTLVRDCIAEGYSLRGIDKSVGNITLTPHNLASYQAVFVDPDSAPTTAAEAETAYTTNVAYEGKGPFGGDGYITAGRVDRTMEPTSILWDDVINQTASSEAVSGYFCCLPLGPTSGRTLAWSVGELWEADDALGTNETELTSPATPVIGKYYEARHTTASGAGVDTTQTFTPNDGSEALTFTSTTQNIVADWKNRYGTDGSVTAGSNRQDTVDIGPPDDDRVVCIVTATGSNFIQNSGDVLLGGNTTTRQLGTNTSAFQVHTIAVGQAGGATSMTLQVNNTSAGSFSRCWSEVYVVYPSGGSATPLDAKTAAASGTSTATTAAITIAAGGYLIVFGGYNGSANPVVPTYSGTDTLVEDDDWVSESATPMWAGHVDVTESTTRTVSTPSNGTSASKTAIGVSWAAPA